MVNTPQTPLPFDVNSVYAQAQIIPVPNLTITASAVSPYVIDLSQYYLTQQIGPQRAVYVDNSANDATIIVLNPYTRQYIVGPPRSIGWYPLLMQPPVRLEVYSIVQRASITSILLQMNFCNLILQVAPYIVENAAPAISGVNLNVAVVGPSPLIAGVALQTIRVHGITLIPSASVAMTLLSAATVKIGPMTSANPIVMPFNEKPYFSCGAGEALNLTLGAAVQVGGLIQYAQSL